MILSDAAIRNRTTVGMMIVLIVIAGAWSYSTLPRESFPEVKIPVIIVTTVYEGVSPADIESTRVACGVNLPNSEIVYVSPVPIMRILSPTLRLPSKTRT